jgi:hypothetical protein
MRQLAEGVRVFEARSVVGGIRTNVDPSGLQVHDNYPETRPGKTL